MVQWNHYSVCWNCSFYNIPEVLSNFKTWGLQFPEFPRHFHKNADSFIFMGKSSAMELPIAKRISSYFYVSIRMHNSWLGKTIKPIYWSQISIYLSWEQIYEHYQRDLRDHYDFKLVNKNRKNKIKNYLRHLKNIYNKCLEYLLFRSVSL